MRRILIAGVLSLIPLASWAADIALVIGNDRYDNGQNLNSAAAIVGTEPRLSAAGFRVVRGRNLDARDMRNAVSDLNAAADGSGRIVIAITGHFATSRSDSWWLATDARAPDLAQVGAAGVSVDTLLEIAGRAPGGAVVLLANDDRSIRLGRGLTASLPDPDVPQGVTFITGSSRDIAGFVGAELTRPGQSLAEGLENWPELEVDGYVSGLTPFLPSAGGAAVSGGNNPDRGNGVTVRPNTSNFAEIAFWGVTTRAGTPEAYREFLQRYPDSRFAGLARQQLDALRTPQERAEETEAALQLSRGPRREIQGNLSLLGFDTRGVDGIFGRGSRTAIRNWQNANGEPVTGFVNRAQIERLQAQADRRAAELEEEARARRADLERKDRGYWRATGQQGDEAGLRAYLERYPDGVFAEIATTRLAPYEAARREAAAAQDRADWDAARSVNTLAAYRGYVQANPQGEFLAWANDRIARLEGQSQNSAALQAAERNEKRLGLNDGTRRIVEDRLTKLGLKPGRVDGVFDNRTRRAIRRYQDARKLTVTGYLDQATFVRLVADSVFR